MADIQKIIILKLVNLFWLFGFRFLKENAFLIQRQKDWRKKLGRI